MPQKVTQLNLTDCTECLLRARPWAGYWGTWGAQDTGPGLGELPAQKNKY